MAIESIESVGVVGLGRLGSGIAACLLGRELNVVGFDNSTETRRDAEIVIGDALDDLHRYARIEKHIVDQWAVRYRSAESIAEVAACDFVIESTFESLQVKRAVLQEIEDAVAESTPIGTNTSALPVSRLQAELRHPERLMGLHFAHPVQATRFLEIIPGEKTSPAAMEAAQRLGRMMDKEPSVLRKDIRGFIVNRLAYAMYREALHLIESGVADAETIDRAFMHSAGIWASICGPLRWMDITGGPVQYAKVMEELLPDLSTSPSLPEAMRRLVDENAGGSSHGRGFYNYTPEEASYWESLLRRHVWNLRTLLDEYGLAEREHATDH